MSETSEDNIREVVRERYGEIARGKSAGCGCAPGCCSPAGPVDASARLGYSAEELAALPEGADMGLGCGNPQAIAGLKKGEVVLDLGCGGGLDCFLAARQVGNEGNVIGVDMTADMIGKARRAAEEGGYGNMEFRLGEIEHIPAADNAVDVIMHAGCVSGAALVSDVEEMLHAAGFGEISITVKETSREFIKDWFPGSGVEDYVASANIEARKSDSDPAQQGKRTLDAQI